METTTTSNDDGQMDAPSTSPGSSVSSTARLRDGNGDDDAAYLDRLLSERKVAESTAGLDCTLKLINAEIDRVVNGREAEPRSSKRFCDVTKDKPIKVTVRTAVPTRDHPKFNFVGKLLGPKGNSLKRLQEETLTKMAILGRGSMRDKQKEEECRHSHEPRYRHLNDELHVEITAYAAPAEAHARIALALTEIRRFLVPDYNDDIRQEQLREMQMMNSGGPSSGTASCGAGEASDGQGAIQQQQQQQQQQQTTATTTHLAAVRSVAGLASPAPSVMTLANPIHQQLSAMTQSPALRPVPYPPVLPLMHPALRGLCKPSQGLAIGLTAAGAAPSAALLNRYRPSAAGLAQLAGTCGPSGMVSLAHPAHHRSRAAFAIGRHGLVKDDYGDASGSTPDFAAAAAAAATFELYHRYHNMQPYGSEGSDGVASPDDRDEAAESELLSANGVVTSADYSLLDATGAGGGGLKLNPSGLDRSRYRHEPYGRYSTKVVT